MVEMTDFRFPLNSRVKLKDNIDPDLYRSMSRTGNEGWVRKHRKDKYDFPQVYIEWDKEHWAYNGTEDGWTWEDHFEGINMPDKQESTEDFGKMVEMMRSFLDRVDNGEDPQSEKTDEQERNMHHEEAQNQLADSESFILITTHHVPDNPDVLVPQAIRYSGSEPGRILAELQLTQLGARAHHNTAIELLENASNGS